MIDNPKILKRVPYDKIEGVYKYPSKSDHSKIYEVIPPNRKDRTKWFCSCKGYHYSQQCSHINDVKKIDDIVRGGEDI